MRKKKILIYNDSPIFGGHEIMTAHVANVLSEKYQVFFLFFNKKIGDLLNKRVEKRKIDISSPIPLGGVRSLYSKDLFVLKKMIKTISPDISIVSQGTIELSLKGALASKWNNIKTVSYIPLCFSSAKMGIKFGKLRDFLNSFFYRLFDGFITISNEQKELIMKWNPEAKVYILPNLIDVDMRMLQMDPSTIGYFRREKVLRIGVVGRIHFRQKGHDKLIEIVEALKKRKMRFKIIVIGDGPDKSKLQYMLKLKKLENFFIFTGWLTDKDAIYNQIDLLLITSNYEGVPLNMLEAVAFYKPVMAPGFGVFKEYLPSVFLYTTPVELSEKIEKFFCEAELMREKLFSVREKVIQLHSKNNFERKVLEIIETFL